MIFGELRHPEYLASWLNAFKAISDKIGAMDHYDAPAGRVNPYFAEKYGVHTQAIVLTGTGDNPATLLGCGSDTVISLGSSYTVNGSSKTSAPASDEPSR